MTALRQTPRTATTRTDPAGQAMAGLTPFPTHRVHPRPQRAPAWNPQPPSHCPASVRPCPGYASAPRACDPCAAQRVPADLRAAS